MKAIFAWVAVLALIFVIGVGFGLGLRSITPPPPPTSTPDIYGTAQMMARAMAVGTAEQMRTEAIATQSTEWWDHVTAEWEERGGVE